MLKVATLVIQSNDVKKLIDSDSNNTKVYLFIRKNKEDVGAQEFYIYHSMFVVIAIARYKNNIKDLKMPNGFDSYIL